MTPTPHTPGPWIHNRIANTIEGGDTVVAKTFYKDWPREEHANGDLIAAAPELLFAAQWALNTLRDAVACPDGCPDELEAALVAAIAKAEGR